MLGTWELTQCHQCGVGNDYMSGIDVIRRISGNEPQCVVASMDSDVAGIWTTRYRSRFSLLYMYVQRNSSRLNNITKEEIMAKIREPMEYVYELWYVM